jgi:hypothetical protein
VGDYSKKRINAEVETMHAEIKENSLEKEGFLTSEKIGKERDIDF